MIDSRESTADPLADVKVGDPVADYLAATEDLCWAPIPGTNVFGAAANFVCSRDRGHPGQHIAHTPEQVVATAPAGGAS